jgi:hypothetical protein
MAETIDDCISSLITISRADGTLQQKMRNAESSICGLLLDGAAEVDEWSEVLRDLLARIRSEINAHHASTREFLDSVIHFIHGQLERASANDETSNH